MDKQKLDVRVDSQLIAYMRALSTEQGVTFTTTVERILRLGLENRRDNKGTLEQKRLRAIDSMKFEEVENALVLEMKKAYLLENFKKLAYKLGQSRDMSKTRRDAVLSVMLERVEILGVQSDEYKACENIVKKIRGEEQHGNHN